MAELILHVGMPKCGTTFLQNALFRNRDRLAEAGLCYPVLTEDSVFHHAVFHAVQARDSSRLEAIRDAVLAQAEPVGRAVISTETFNWNPDPAHALFVRDHFCDAFTSTTVILYFRNIFEYLASWYAEAVQGFENRDSRSSPEFLTDAKIRQASYPDVLTHWADAFGPDRVVSRLFNRADFRNRSIVEDFLSLAGLPLPEGYQSPPADLNTSLGLRELAVMRRVNAGVSPVDRPFHAALRDAVATRCRGLGAGDRRMALSPGQVDRIAGLVAADRQRMSSLVSEEFADALYTAPGDARLATPEAVDEIERIADHLLSNPGLEPIA